MVQSGHYASYCNALFWKLEIIHSISKCPAHLSVCVWMLGGGRGYHWDDIIDGTIKLDYLY